MAEESKEESEEDQTPEEEQETPDEENQEKDEETVENIEEQTEGGLLGSYSKEAVLAGGLMLGLALGLLVGYGAVSADPSQVQEANPEEVQSQVEQLLTAGQQDAPDFEFGEVQRKNGMYYMTVTYETEVPETNENGTRTNETTTQEREDAFYVTVDGELLFPEVQNFQLQSPISIQDALDRVEQRQQQTQQPSADNSTSDNSAGNESDGNESSE